MGIVEEAQSKEEETSGAVQGGATAAFLSEETPEGGEALLDSLQRDDVAPGAVREKSRVAGAAADEAKAEAKAEAKEVVRELVEEAPEPTPTQKPSTEVPNRPDGHDASMIDDLLASDDEDGGAERP